MTEENTTSLKSKTLKGLSWSFVDNFACQGITFIVGVILARLIAPSEFGVVGLITFFIAVSTQFVDGGFATALTRKIKCTSTDYDTVFLFNLVMGIAIYILLFFLAPWTSNFFDEPRLTNILRIGGLVIPLNALCIIQITILVKNIDFKTKALINLAASIFSGGLALIMVYLDYGIWSLVWRNVFLVVAYTILHWIVGKWRPKLYFSKTSFKELFGFGSKLLLSRLIYTITTYIYLPIIGKFFSTTQLAYFSQASKYSGLISETLAVNFERVSYPALAHIQDDGLQFKLSQRKIVNLSTIIISSAMLGLLVIAKPMILLLIGDPWLPCVPFLQLMCITALFGPLILLCQSPISIKGGSNIILMLNIFGQVFDIPILIVGYFYGIKALLVGGIVGTIINYVIACYYSSTYTNYTMKEQFLDILRIMSITLVASSPAFYISFLDLNLWIMLGLQLGITAFLTITIYEILKFSYYL